MSLGLAGALSAAAGALAGLADGAAAVGYPAIALVVALDGVIPAFPGETAVVAGAVLAGQGELLLPLVILAGALGAMIGDWTAYWIGHAGEGPIRRTLTRMAGAARVAAAERMVARQGPALVIIGRFLPGLRIGVNAACGAGLMPFRRFVIFNAVGALMWAATAAALGFFLGRAFAARPWIALAVAVGATLVVGAVVAVRERVLVRREAAALRAAAGAPTAP